MAWKGLIMELSNDEKEMYMMLLPNWDSQVAVADSFYTEGERYWQMLADSRWGLRRRPGRWLTLDEAFFLETGHN